VCNDVDSVVSLSLSLTLSIGGLAMGIALIMYGREEGAEVLIEQLSRDKVRTYILQYSILCICFTLQFEVMRNAQLKRTCLCFDFHTHCRMRFYVMEACILLP